MKRKYNLIVALIFIIFIFSLTSLLYIFDIFKPLEFMAYNWMFQLRGQILNLKDTNIIIIKCDDESIAQMQTIIPFSRKIWAKVIKRLKSCKPRVIALDFLFDTTQKDDHLFLKVLDKNIVLGGAIFLKQKHRVLTSNIKDSSINQIFEAYRKNKKQTIRKNTGYFSNENIEVILPAKKFRSKCNIGIIGVRESIDNTVREAPLIFNYPDLYKFPEINRAFPSFSLLITAKYLGLEKKLNRYIKNLKPGEPIKDILKIGDLKIPVNENGWMYINFKGQASVKPLPLQIPLYQIYDDNIFHEQFDKKLFKDKIILIGPTTTASQDIHPTPFDFGADTRERGMPGIEIHAHAIWTMLTRKFIKRLNFKFRISTLGIFAVIFTFLSIYCGILLNLLLFITLSTIYLYCGYFLFVNHGLWIDIVSPLLTGGFAFFSVISWKIFHEQREKYKIKTMFSRYVHPDVVKTILKNTDSVKPGGKRVKISILFSDIRGFTGMSEKMEPEEIVLILNEYLAKMTEIIFKNKGTLDKFIGDAIMALYGVPVPLPDHALRAVKTAVEMQQALPALRKKWEQYGAGARDLAIGIGINTGEVVVGNIGSPQRMDYTAIGDHVNIASRLESNAKKDTILISESTYELVKDYVIIDSCFEMKVKGKEKPLKVYKIKGIKD